jgi:hypothetical protein
LRGIANGAVAEEAPLGESSLTMPSFFGTFRREHIIPYMAKYQVAIIGRPAKWRPECADDVPLELRGPVEVLAESDDLFVAVRRAIEHNRGAESQCRGRWAVVIEPGSGGRFWPAARLCTPITYRVATIWWPDGWEPQSPLDVPNCIMHTREQAGGDCLSYPRAEAIVLALNRQCTDHPANVWHVVLAAENEAVSRTVSYDSAGTETTVEVRPMHVIRPAAGGRGDCLNCPARALECAQAEWSSLSQTVSARHSRAFGPQI